MRRRYLIIGVLLASAAAGILGFTAATGSTTTTAAANRHADTAATGPALGSSSEDLILQLIPSYLGSAVFHNVPAAEAAGYAELRDAEGIACIERRGRGAMGVHYVNGDLVGDTVLDPARPEAVVYEPGGKGKWKRRHERLELVALEYIVFQEAWDEAHTEWPSLFGRKLRLVPSPNRYGLPAFYELHAWIWKANPSGLFADYNRRVDC